MKLNFKSKKGFSLLEVLIAIIILASGIMLLASAWSSNYVRLRKSRLYNNVSALLERKVTELEVLYIDRPLDEIPDELSGTFEGYEQYTWTFTSKEFEMPDLTAALVARDGGADDTFISMIKQMTEFISKSMKEGTVTIHVNLGGKRVKYSVTTYFVDYEKEMSISGGG